LTPTNLPSWQSWLPLEGENASALATAVACAAGLPSPQGEGAGVGHKDLANNTTT